MSLRRSAVRRIAAVAALAVASVITPLAGIAPDAAAEAPLSLSEIHSPTVVSFAEGRLDVFWTAPTGGLRQRFLRDGGSWSRAITRGGSLASQPAAVSWGPGRVDVFARGTDDRLKWRTRTAAGWSDWKSLGGALGSAPAVTSWAPGRLDVFVRWSDGKLYQRTLVAGSWRAWTSRGGILTSSPAAATWRKGRIDLVARTVDHKLVHRVYTLSDGWSRWRNLGDTAVGQPALVSAAPQRLDLFFRGPAGYMRRRSFLLSEGWFTSWIIGSKVFGSGPAATAIGEKVVLVARSYSKFYLTSRPEEYRLWRPWELIDPYLPFRGLGTWVDVLDYNDPELVPTTAVAVMKTWGDVRTLYLSTGRFDSAEDFYDEEAMAAWLDAAHAAGIRVVGWYVPGYGDLDRDVRRVVAIDDYVSPTGQRFDGIGVDIERFGTSGEVDLDTFNAAVVHTSRRCGPGRPRSSARSCPRRTPRIPATTGRASPGRGSARAATRWCRWPCGRSAATPTGARTPPSRCTTGWSGRSIAPRR